MKQHLLVLAAPMTFLVGAPALALETLSLYDDFNVAPINRVKWTGSASGTLETTRVISFPSAADGELALSARSYGYRTPPGSEEGRSGFNRLSFRRANPDTVRAIKATIRVTGATAAGCPTAGAEVTQARIRLYGFFFNAGNAEPDAAVNDVFGTLEIRRLSTSTVDRELEVRARVGRCMADPDCFVSQTLYTKVLGTTTVGASNSYLMQWDPDNNAIRFQFNANPVEIYSYTLSDSAPPENSFSKKRIEIHHFVASCAAAQTSAFMSATVDDVYVNTAAAAAPATAASDGEGRDTLPAEARETEAGQ